MSPTERCSFSYKYIPLAKLNFESDEDSSDENELTNSESATNIVYENLNSYGEEEGENEEQEEEEEEKDEKDEKDEEVEEEEEEKELYVTPISRFSTMDYSTKLNNIRRRLFIDGVRRRLFSYNFEKEDIED